MRPKLPLAAAAALSSALLLLSLTGCAGKTPPPIDPCLAAEATETAACALDPAGKACTNAKQLVATACSHLPTACSDTAGHTPSCPLPGQSDDPTKFCGGCWECSPRGNYQWTQFNAACPAPVTPSCPATCPAGQACSDPAKGCVAVVTPPATLPAAQPYLDDTKLTLKQGDTSVTRFPDLVAGVRAYQKAEPSHWNGDTWTVPISTALPRLSAYLALPLNADGTPHIRAAQSIAANGQVSDCILVARADPSVFECYHAYGIKGAWANTAGSMKGVYTSSAQPVVTPTPPTDPLAALAPLPNRGAVKLNCKYENKHLDCTPIATGNAALCAAYGFTDGRSNCAMGADLTAVRWGRERYALGQDGGSMDPPGVPGPGVCGAQPASIRASPLSDNWLECSGAGPATALQLCGSGAQAKVCGAWVATK